MAVPVSVEAQFARLKKSLKELKNVSPGALAEEECVIVGEICNSCILTLDKAMNAVWTKRADRTGGSGKPNIYFPIGLVSHEALSKKFRQYQMPNLEKDDPVTFALIASAQEYRGSHWLTPIAKLARIRHERFPEIKNFHRQGLISGNSQVLVIDELTQLGGGSFRLKGHGVNQVSGDVEPLKFRALSEMRSELEGIGEDPCKFCAKSVALTRRLVFRLYRSLAK